jgi:hypothetical protein
MFSPDESSKVEATPRRLATALRTEYKCILAEKISCMKLSEQEELS